MSNLSRIPSTKLTKTLKLVDFLRRKLLQSFQLKESYSKRRLDGNPLSCDCNLKWFIDFSHQVSSEKSVQLSAVCASPPSLADTPTESLWREHDMICGMYFKILQAVKSLTEYTRRAGEGKGKILQTCFSVKSRRHITQWRISRKKRRMLKYLMKQLSVKQLNNVLSRENKFMPTIFNSYYLRALEKPIGSKFG